MILPLLIVLETVGFTQAIDMAIGSSVQRQEAEADLRADAAKRREAIAEAGPKVRAEGTDTRFDKPVDIAFGPQTFTLRPDTYRNGSLAVTQPVTGLYAAYEKAGLMRTERESGEMGVSLARATAAFDAAEAYRRAQQADELVRIAKASIAATDGQVRDASSLERSGRLIRSDFLKIQIAHQDARAQLARAVAGQEKAHAKLRYRVGLPPEGGPLALEPLPAPSKVALFQPPALTAAVEQAGKSRLEVQQAALSLEKEGYMARLSKARFAPNVDLFMRWDRVYSEPPFGTPPFTRSFGVAASWDLWDNGAKVFAAQEQAAHVDKATTALQEAKDKLRLEVQGLLADLTAAKEGLAATQATVAQAEEAYRLDKARFSSGLVTATDLLLSEAGQTRARGALVTALTDTDVLIMNLQKSLGADRPK